MTDYERIEKVIRYLDRNYRTQPPLKELAKIAGLSEFHFIRLFGRWTGTTPKSFLQFLTAKEAKKLLLESKDLLSTSLDVGLSGPSRLHDLILSIDSVTPGELKRQGSGVEILYGFHESPFGKCLIGITKRGICHLTFLVSDRDLAIHEMKSQWKNAHFTYCPGTTAKILQRAFQGKEKQTSLHVRGTPFQIKVWEALIRIPEGTLVSYTDLAKQLGTPGAARAVGSAVARNTIAYLIPCHRVIRETGVVGDYRWGTIRKKAILSWEQTRRSSVQFD